MTTTLTAKGPEDLLAAVPVVLGFEPEESLVMMTFGGAHPFHARLDLPPPGEVDPAVATMLRPALDNRVGAAAFVVYTGDRPLARRLGRRLVERFAGAGIRVVDCLRADGRRWFPLAGTHPGIPGHGVPYDPGAHPFRAQAVYDGLVTLGSRAELEASVAADPVAVAEVEGAVARARPLDADEVVALVARSLSDGRVARVEELAALLLGLAAGRLRERSRLGLGREQAPGQVRLWADVVRRAPEALVAEPAALLALWAWLAGQGALAWCAVDRCLAADSRHGLGTTMARVLTDAIPPSTWADRLPTTEVG